MTYITPCGISTCETTKSPSGTRRLRAVKSLQAASVCMRRCAEHGPNANMHIYHGHPRQTSSFFLKTKRRLEYDPLSMPFKSYAPRNSMDYTKGHCVCYEHEIHDENSVGRLDGCFSIFDTSPCSHVGTNHRSCSRQGHGG